MIMNAAIPIVYIYRASRPVDLRKGIDGIASIVQSLFQMDPYEHSLFIFTSGSRNRIKILYCDGSGYWLMLKRMDEGRFKWCIGSSDTITISQKQFARLIHGFPYLEADTNLYERLNRKNNQMAPRPDTFIMESC